MAPTSVRSSRALRRQTSIYWFATMSPRESEGVVRVGRAKRTGLDTAKEVGEGDLEPRPYMPLGACEGTYKSAPIDPTN